MKKLELTEIRDVEKGILVHFKKFCESNNIRYYLSNGTLLGAIKYRGFIPWDDDIDVFVPRKDYNRLIEAYKDENPYKLFSFEREKDFHFPFAKLCDMTTLKCENNIDNGVQLGIDIDIFPLDVFEVNETKAKKEVKKLNRYLFALNLSKLKETGSGTVFKRIGKRLMMTLTKFKHPDFYINKIIDMATKFQLGESIYVGCKVWPIYEEKEIIPAKVFSESIEVVFEGETYVAPKGYDIYLSSLYGDYMSDPPIDKQCTHHAFTAYRLDN